MKLNLSKEQKVGLFSLSILVALYILINFLSGIDIFNKSNTYYAIYDNVEGLTPTGPVYIRGLKVGTVESINYLQEKDVFLTKLRVSSNYAIPKNSVAEIYSEGILGSKAVRINIGNDNIYLQSRDTIQSATEKGIMAMISTEIIPLKDQMSNLIATLNSTLTNVNDILDPQAKENISASLANLRKTMGNIESISSNIDKHNPEISSIIANFDNLSSELTASMLKLNSSLDNMVDITDSLKTADIAGTVNSMKNLLEEIRNPEGSIGKLLKTDNLHSSIDSLINDLNTLIKNINENPKKYIKVSVF